MSGHRKCDLIGIGGSAGGLPALIDLLENFEPQGDATIFVVIHRAAESEHLVPIIARASPFEVCEPAEGEPLRPNCLYLGGTDAHMTIAQDHIHLRRGPRENNFRPAIDPLFRSLAVFGSTRATGVVLSGYLDDGAAGARAILRSGGRVVVQDPADAISPSMPRATISAVGEPDLIAPTGQIGEHLGELVTRDAEPAREVDPDIRLELMISGLEKASMSSEDGLGELSPYNCPDCNGVLWEIEDGPLLRFRCHTGHAYSSGSLSHRQEQMLEQRLFDSLRACRERAHYTKKMAERDPTRAGLWEAKAKDHEEDCTLLENLIQSQQRKSSDIEGSGDTTGR